MNCGMDIVDALLADSDLVGNESATNALLEFKLLLTTAAPVEIVDGFFELRAAVRNRFYLSMYRLRRWLENQLEVQIVSETDKAGYRSPLKLRFASRQRLENAIRHEHFEHNLEVQAFDGIGIRFVARDAHSALV